MRTAKKSKSARSASKGGAKSKASTKAKSAAKSSVKVAKRAKPQAKAKPKPAPTTVWSEGIKEALEKKHPEQNWPGAGESWKGKGKFH